MCPITLLKRAEVLFLLQQQEEVFIYTHMLKQHKNVHVLIKRI